MICPQCDNAYLLPGYAIQPIGGFPRCCRTYHPHTIAAENVEIVFVGKCPKCGYNEELSPLVQEILKQNPPIGYANWNQYWESDKKKIAEDWLEALA